MNHAMYLELSERLKRLEYAYFVLDSPEISDAEYDLLLRQLLDYEAKHPGQILPDSPSRRVGAAPLPLFEKAEHIKPLLSLDNAFSAGELRDFVQRLNKALPDQELHFFCETKFDGLSLAVYYQEGLMQKAITRGDGIRGELVTPNVKTIRTLPLSLKTNQEVAMRGEVVFPKVEFLRFNTQQQEAGQKTFANPRNAASGSLRQLDSKITASRRLHCYVYDLLVPVLGVNTQAEGYQFLKDQGFMVDPGARLCRSLEEVLEFYTEILERRDQLPYEIDGVVIKLNSFRQQEDLGKTARAPRYAIAFKFPPRQARARIKDISVQVGRTGVLTPVAEFEPVSLSGTTIRFATLHNWDEIRDKDIRIGDLVTLERAGDVIPHVVSVDISARSPTASLLPLPTQCPDCSGSVLQKDGEVAFRCINPYCKSRELGRLKHFVQRDAIDLAGFGFAVLEDLYMQKLVAYPTDLFLLTEEHLLQIDHAREKLAAKLKKSLESRLKIPLDRYLFGLGIEHVGLQAARLLARSFGSIEALVQAGRADFLAQEGIGPRIADALVDFFQSPYFAELEARRRRALVEIVPLELKTGILEGKKVCFTGTLSSMDRHKAQAFVSHCGGEPVDTVSKKTSILVYGSDAGSKLEKAKNLGISVLSEAEFFVQFPLNDWGG